MRAPIEVIPPTCEVADCERLRARTDFCYFEGWVTLCDHHHSQRAALATILLMFAMSRDLLTLQTVERLVNDNDWLRHPCYQ